MAPFTAPETENLLAGWLLSNSPSYNNVNHCWVLKTTLQNQWSTTRAILSNTDQLRWPCHSSAENPPLAARHTGNKVQIPFPEQHQQQHGLAVLISPTHSQATLPLTPLQPGSLLCAPFVSVALLLRLAWLVCDPVDCSPPGSSVHGISRARILEWIAISFSRGPSQPRDWSRLTSIMAPHSSILAWKIPWLEEPGVLQFMGWQRVGHDWATSLTHSPTLQADSLPLSHQGKPSVSL